MITAFVGDNKLILILS